MLRFVALLAAIAALTPFAIDMYLPAMPRIAADLAVSLGQVQASLSTFLLGFAGGQLVHGPLADAWGRRRLLLGALACFGGFSMLCALAPTLDALLLWRFGQALAGAGASVVVSAAITDRYRGKNAIRVRSMMVSVMTLAPLVAPSIGAWMARIAGWRSLFWLLAVIALVNFIQVWRFLPESLKERQSLRPSAIAVNYWQIVSGRGARFEFPALALASAGFFAFLTATPYLYMTQLGLSDTQYALAFAANVMALTGCAWLNSRLAGKVKPRWLLQRALLAQAGLALVVVVSAAIDGLHLWLHGPLWWAGIGLNGLVFANGAAIILERFRSRAGTASAVLGASQFGAGALSSVVVATASTIGVVAVVAVPAVCLGVSALLLFQADRDDQQPRPSLQNQTGL